ncbi:ribosomal protein S18-alanine N-acetyltransferase [Clostridium hydrogenum]|uniref:ribosomal protein S18-alanine N-acetyltransferase n=1 Tax=Clostridium hydrogenum TaxID=2855764 RepID=UPI001F334601|nr:ribosomal protein S18-alanine N-acetyltransferase [Clostridium hydrogenum]
MSNLEVCSFEKKYLREIMSIENLSFSIPWTKDAMEKELTNKFAKYVVVKLDNLVIGYGGMWLILDEGHITNIAVHPEFRGIGAGKKIIEALIDVCKKNDISSLTLEVRVSNYVAKNLYTKFGFIEEGIRKNYYNDNNEDAIIMWKRNI